MKGIILAGGSGTRLYPITEGISKQLIPVYDKPMIFYPLSVLMQAKIRNILIITTSIDLPLFKRLLGDGSEFGININYVIQPSPDGLAQAFILGEEFVGTDTCAMILGDNIFCGADLDIKLFKAKENVENGLATIFGYKVKDPQRFGVMELDSEKNVISLEEKPEHPKSDYAVTGLYFFDNDVIEKAKTLKPSARGELEITDLNNLYLEEKKLRACLLEEGYTWFDTGTFDSLLDASNMIRVIQNNNSLVACPEKIAYENGWLSNKEMEERALKLSKNSYGQYLRKIIGK